VLLGLIWTSNPDCVLPTTSTSTNYANKNGERFKRLLSAKRSWQKKNLTVPGASAPELDDDGTADI
jgi:hypothetical protein